MNLVFIDGGAIYFAINAFLPLLSALVLIPLLVQLDSRKLVSAKPGIRRSHIRTVSCIGGIGIIISASIGFFCAYSHGFHRETNLILAAFLLIFIAGVKDDILESGPWFKLGSQFIISLILTVGAGLTIDNLHGFIGLYELPQTLNLVFSILFILTIINAINLIDGIDGLAALIGITGFSTSAIIFYISEEYFLLAMSISMIGALIGFLRYNFSAYDKVFMGDTGSLFIGLGFAVFMLKMWSFYDKEISLPSQPLWIISMALIPLFDLCRVAILRISNGRSPFHGDRNHIHHILVDHCLLSHKKASVLLSLLSIVIIACSIAIAYAGSPGLLISWYGCLFLYYLTGIFQMQRIGHIQIHLNLSRKDPDRTARTILNNQEMV